MFNYKNFHKGIFGIIALAFLIIVSTLVSFNVNFFFLSVIYPLFIITFLIVPYINQEATLLGSLIGLVISYSIILRLDFSIIIIASVIISLLLSLYSKLFIREPENKKHIVINIIYTLLILTPVSYLLSILNSLNNNPFFSSFLSLIFINVVITPVIISLITYFYGVKINSLTIIFRDFKK
jgi:hypothetical protein